MNNIQKNWALKIITVLSAIFAFATMAGLILVYLIYINTNTTSGGNLNVSPTITQSLNTIIPTVSDQKNSLITIDSSNDPYSISHLKLTYPKELNVEKTFQALETGESSVIKIDNSEITFQSTTYSENDGVFHGISQILLDNGFYVVNTKNDADFSYFSYGSKIIWEDDRCGTEKNNCFYFQYLPEPERWDNQWKISYKIPKGANQDQIRSLIENADLNSFTLTLDFEGQMNEEYSTIDTQSQKEYYSFKRIQDTTKMDEYQLENYRDYGPSFVVKKSLIDGKINLQDSDIRKRFIIIGNFSALYEGPDPDCKIFEIASITPIE